MLKHYVELINWEEILEDLPIMEHLSDQEIQNIVELCGEGELSLRLPCYIQSGKLAVKITTATFECKEITIKWTKRQIRVVKCYAQIRDEMRFSGKLTVCFHMFIFKIC